MEGVELRGMGVALATPFKEDKSIDFDSLSGLIRHIMDGHADYIVVLGTTAETPTLSLSERNAVKEFIIEKTDGKIPLVVGMGGNSTRALCEEIQTADFTGYSAILSVTPYYNKPSQNGLYLHFSEIAGVSPLPVILYNVPGRTGVNLDADTTLQLARNHKNIIAIKEASGRLKQIEEIIDNSPEGFQVISGDDSLTYSLIKMGAAGVISVVGNAFPREYGLMVKKCLSGEFDEARRIDIKFSGLYEALFSEGNPAGIKSLLHSLGIIKNELRLPLVRTSKETDDRIREIMSEFRTDKF